MGAPAADLLRVRAAALDRRDAALATELVLGTLRYQNQLDHLLRRYAGRAPEKLDREVRIALRLGVYQLRYLDRIPRHAAVDDSVEMMYLARKRSATGFVNAILRKVTRDPVEWPSHAVAVGLPEWLWNRWSAEFGAERAKCVARACLTPPETYLRVPPNRKDEAEPLRIEKTAVPGCCRLLGDHPGPFRIQDIGSQTIVPLLDLQPGMRFLDVAAAPGNKTAQALESGVRAVACDASYRRLSEMPRLECPLAVADACRTLPFPPVFDRILLDAPCSGTGTLRRNPEIKWRVTEKDLVVHQERQVRMLTHAVQCLVTGGRLVYSTCSLEREENEMVVQQVLDSEPMLHLEMQMRRFPGEQPGDGFFAAVITWKKPLSG